MKLATVTLTRDQIGIIIDSIHDRFMAIAHGTEAHPPASRTVILDSLGRLHGKLQAAEEALEEDSSS